MKENIRSNVIVNLIRTFVLTILSFITFPWVCRYLGDSILGEFAHTGAGVILSNFKSDGSNVKIRRDGEVVETGLRKFGAILGNHADIGCNSVLFPGTIIGQNTNIYPLTRVRGEVLANKIVKDEKTIVDKEER